MSERKGEIREALGAQFSDGEFTYVVGEQRAYRGKAGCRDVRCSRMNGECYGWHCAKCDGLADGQGDCLGDCRERS